MIKTLIIGKNSNLSNELKKELVYSKVFSLRDLKKDFTKLNQFLINLKKFNVIINSWYPSHLLKNINNKKKLYNEISIKFNKKIIEELDYNKINKIIFSSSSSIYYLNDFTMNKEKYIYAKSKLDFENYLLKKFNNKIIIARIYNLYGGNDKFSVINKIFKSYKKKKIFLLNNKGLAERDFIYVNDVAKIYSKIIKSKLSGIYDVGTGKSVKIYDILNFLGTNNFYFKHIRIPEVKKSVAKIDKNKLDIFKTKMTLENYLIQRVVNYY